MDDLELDELDHQDDDGYWSDEVEEEDGDQEDKDAAPRQHGGLIASAYPSCNGERHSPIPGCRIDEVYTHPLWVAGVLYMALHDRGTVPKLCRPPSTWRASSRASRPHRWSHCLIASLPSPKRTHTHTLKNPGSSLTSASYHSSTIPHLHAAAAAAAGAGGAGDDVAPLADGAAITAAAACDAAAPGRFSPPKLAAFSAAAAMAAAAARATGAGGSAGGGGGGGGGRDQLLPRISFPARRDCAAAVAVPQPPQAQARALGAAQQAPPFAASLPVRAFAAPPAMVREAGGTLSWGGGIKEAGGK